MPCAVTGLALNPVSFGELASGPPSAGARVTFRSPAYFSQNGSRVVLPDPRLIVGSWRRRWNASVSAPDLLVTDESSRELNAALRLTEFDLHTERRDDGYGRQIPGFTGSAVLRLDKTAEEAKHIFGTLARFAEFCGTGAQTTHGFGATTITSLPP
jgi:CRISPR-associated endoribonuclease Cas6